MSPQDCGRESLPQPDQGKGKETEKGQEGEQWHAKEQGLSRAQVSTEEQ